MIRLLILPLLLFLLNPGPVFAQDDCFLGDWEFDPMFISEYGVFMSGDENVTMPEMHLDYSFHSGGAFVTFSAEAEEEGGVVYSFEDWVVTYTTDLGSEEMSMPGEILISVRMDGDYWGTYHKYPDGDNMLNLTMGGVTHPEPNVETSAWMDIGDQRMDMYEMSADEFKEMFGSHFSGITYSCVDEDGEEALYVDGESAGGMFHNARLFRVGDPPPR